MPVVLAAPGTGKSHWVQKQELWTDEDEWAATRGLHSAEWHRKKHTEEDTVEHYRHIDAELAKLPEDVYMIGSLYWDFVPDAIVLIDPVIHRERVRKRHDLHWHTVAEVVRDLQEKALRYGVPVFDSFDKASEYVMHRRRSNRRGAFNDATAR